jgi:3-methylfumaryl-CoA hydratase
MWAGGRVRANGPLRCGETATRRSCVLSVQDKQGRSGPLTFIVMQHQILQRGQVVIDERQEIVCREAVSSPSGGQEAPIVETPMAVPAADDEWQIDVSPVLLFRFSALTYNAHRIHYDRDYARDTEGYSGLVTHGPLQALAMAEAARAATGRAEGRRHHDFAYRLESPLFDHQGMIVRAVTEGAAITTGVRDSFGRRTASGTYRGGDL